MSAALIAAFGQSLTVYRDTNPEKSVKGARVADKFESFVVTASVQPMEPDEIIEETVGAERNTQGIKIYTATELKVVDEVNRFKADQVEYMGERYEVQKIDKWQMNKMSLVHYKCIAVRVNKVLKA